MALMIFKTTLVYPWNQNNTNRLVVGFDEQTPVCILILFGGGH